jgi:hypothetical protein
MLDMIGSLLVELDCTWRLRAPRAPLEGCLAAAWG